MRLTIEAWRKDNILSGLFGEIGPLMESLFDGENGQKLMQTTSVFCQHQQHALDILRQRYFATEPFFFHQQSLFLPEGLLKMLILVLYTNTIFGFHF